MRIVEAGSRTILDSDGSFIENNAFDDRIEIKHENGCFILDLWLPCKPIAIRPGNDKSSGNDKCTTKVVRPRMADTTISNRWNAFDDDDNDEDNMNVSGASVRQDED